MAFKFAGTVSHGTHITKDLIDSFLEVLTVLDYSSAHYFRSELTKHEDNELEDVLNNLFDELNNNAPDFMYFGAHPGDGSDFGFWLDNDVLADAVAEDECLAVSDLAEIPDHWTKAVVLINDHGNTTLYRPVVIFEEVASFV